MKPVVPRSLFCLLVFFIPLLAGAVTDDQFGFHGYVRAGIGSNDKGGSQLCVGNSGAGSNEFRLGNECGIYNEMSFQALHLKPEGDKKSYFLSRYTLAMSQEGMADWEDNAIALREIYAEGGKFAGTPYTFWAGKRFYRDADIFMNDWYYFADMSGNGAGVGAIPFAGGELAVAWLRYVNKNDPNGTELITNVGYIAMDVLDFRLKGLKVADGYYLKGWLALAQTSTGVGVLDGKTFGAIPGAAVGALLEHGLERGGFNHFSLQYGHGALNDFRMSFNLLEEGGVNHEAAKEANRWRIVNHLLSRPSQKWAYFLATLAEIRDSGVVSNSQESWYSVGIRPVYFVNKHFQWSGQLGSSVVVADGQDDRVWTRLSLGPQVALGDGVWSRPTLTAFVTYNHWNDANAGTFSDKGSPNYAYNGENDMLSFGARMEVFF